MNKPEEDWRILVMADDDADDRLLLREAALQCEMPAKIEFVQDGVELMEYLEKQGKFLKEPSARQILILLDLNMPRMDGFQALAQIKSSALRHIPVVVLSTSGSERDIQRSYSLGASSYIKKPSTYEELVRIVQSIKDYWMKSVSIPFGETAAQPPASPQGR